MAVLQAQKTTPVRTEVAFWLLYEGKLVLAAFNECNFANLGVFGGFYAVYGDGARGDEIATFTLAGGEAGLDEDIEELGAFCGGREALGEKIEFIGAEVRNLAFAEENAGDFLGGICGVDAMNNFCNHVSERALAVASAWVLGVLGEDFAELVRGDEGVILEVFAEDLIWLVEPELVEVENAGFLAVEPDGVAFGLAEFAAGDLVDNERARVSVGFGALETTNEVDARGAVAVLVGAAELEINVMGAEKVKEVVALNEGVAKLGVADAGAAFADALLDELAIEKLSHAECLADFAEEWEELNLAKPIEVIENLGVGWGMSDADDLLRECDFVLRDFVETLEVAFDGVLRITDLAGGATNEIIRSIAVANEAGAHHKSSEVADMKRIGTRVGAPIKITRSFV